jgi:hypothetical protein
VDNTATQALTDTATVQVATAAATTSAAAPAVHAGQAMFELSPTLANSNVLLNYNTLEGIEIYSKTTARMEVLYNGGLGNM